MNDFADWLSPIVVKELRQGMRSRAFVGIFLLVQVFMILCILTAAGEDEAGGSSGFFWVVTGVALLIVMPLRGLATLNSEIKGNTIEILLLTQLSAWRVTAGKWSALFLQTLLLVSAVLPYLMLRYFLGGVNLVSELAILGWMLAGSALLTALAVGLSPSVNTLVGRLGLGMLSVFGFYGLQAVMESFRFGIGGSGSAGDARLWLALTLLVGPLAILQCFELGLGKIAPLAENHATRKRLLAFAIVVVAGVIGSWFGQRELLAVIAGVSMAPVCLGAISEEPVPFPSVYRGFVRRGFLGRLSGKLLYPGWPAGLLFSLVLFATVLYCGNFKPGIESIFFVAAGLGAAVFPLAIVRMFVRKRIVAISVFGGIQAVSFLIAVVLAITLKHDSHPVWPAFLPLTGLFLKIFSSQHVTMPVYSAISASVTGLSLLLVIIRSIPEWRKVGGLEKEAMLAE